MFNEFVNNLGLIVIGGACLFLIIAAAKHGAERGVMKAAKALLMGAVKAEEQCAAPVGNKKSKRRKQNG